MPHPYHTTGGRGDSAGSPGSTPLPSICKLLATFLRSSFVFARSWQHFWLPALAFTRYMLPFRRLRSTHTPSKYLRATYSHIYMCYVSTVSTSYLLPVYSDNTTCVLHIPYLPYMSMMPCIPYLSYLSYIPYIQYIWNVITTPTIHTIANIHAMHTTPTLHRKYSIPVIVTIHTIQTIHTVISNIPYPTDLPYLPSIQSNHSSHTYHTYHTYQHNILSKHAIPDRPYTPYIPNIPYHTPTTPQGGGEDLIWGQYMGPIPWRGGGGGGRAWCIYAVTTDSLHHDSLHSLPDNYLLEAIP